MKTSRARKSEATRKGETTVRNVAERSRRAHPANTASTRKRRRAVRKTPPGRPAPSVVPMISYENGTAALDWLRRSFGFREKARHTTPDGTLSHGEMETGAGLIML